MCEEKNLEGKILSPPPSDENDETIPSDWKPVKKTKKKRSRKRIKPKICKTCQQNILENEKRDSLMYKNTYHQLQVKEYCKDHEFKYSGHKCKPHWCGDCDYLIKYEIEIEIQER